MFFLLSFSVLAKPDFNKYPSSFVQTKVSNNYIVLHKYSSTFTATPYLFSVEKDGIVSFLFGTIHLGVYSVDLPSFVKDAIFESKYFASESGESTNEDEEDKDYRSWDKLTPKTQAEFLKDSFFLANSSKEALIKFVNSYPYEELYIVALVISLFEFFNDEHVTLDNELQTIASFLDKPIYKLDQDDLVDAHWKALLHSYDVNKLFLHSTLSSLKNDFIETRSEYLTGKIEFAQDDTDMEMKARNVSWIPTLEQLHQKGGFFAAFGADHLGGKNGVIKLLENKGYKIKQVLTQQQYTDLSNK